MECYKCSCIHKSYDTVFVNNNLFQKYDCINKKECDTRRKICQEKKKIFLQQRINKNKIKNMKKKQSNCIYIAHGDIDGSGWLHSTLYFSKPKLTSSKYEIFKKLVFNNVIEKHYTFKLYTEKINNTTLKTKVYCVDTKEFSNDVLLFDKDFIDNYSTSDDEELYDGTGTDSDCKSFSSTEYSDFEENFKSPF